MTRPKSPFEDDRPGRRPHSHQKNQTGYIAAFFLDWHWNKTDDPY